jgi:hypothetical protein
MYKIFQQIPTTCILQEFLVDLSHKFSVEFSPLPAKVPVDLHRFYIAGTLDRFQPSLFCQNVQ